MAIKKKTSAQLQYEKELRRIKQFVKRAEKRGYRFDKNVVPEKPKRITQASINKLKKITPKQLYEKATSLSETAGVITGTERRKEERKESAKKGAETRRKRIEQASKQTKGFESKRRKQDEQEKRRLKEEQAFREKFNQGRIIYNSILGMINDIGKQHKRSAQHLKSVLQNEIKEYGESKVFQNMAVAPSECVELAQIALKYGINDPRHDMAIRELMQLITGTIPTAQESKEMQENIEADMDYGSEY